MEKMYRNYQTVKNVNPLVLILGLVFGLFFVFWFIKNVIFKILYLVAPVLFIAALVMNYKVVWGYVIWLFNSIRTRPLFGLAATAISIIAYPFVGLYLALRAYQLRGGGAHQRNEPMEGEFIKYTEVEEEEFLDISREKQRSEDLKTDYSDLI